MKAEMNNYKTWIKYKDENILSKEIEKDLIESGFNIVDKCEYYFSPIGYTGLWLLSESHFAIHSFPEKNKIYIELTSCVKDPFDRMIRKIKKYK